MLLAQICTVGTICDDVGTVCDEVGTTVCDDVGTVCDDIGTVCDNSKSAILCAETTSCL